MTHIRGIRLTGRWAWYSLVVMLVSFGRYSHGLFELSNGKIIDASFQYGVKERNLEPAKGWSWYFDLTAVLPIAILREMYLRAKSYEGYPYDDRFLVGYLFNRRSMQQPLAFVCFEFLVEVLRPWVLVKKDSSRAVSRHIVRALTSLKGKGFSCCRQF